MAEVNFESRVNAAVLMTNETFGLLSQQEAKRLFSSSWGNYHYNKSLEMYLPMSTEEVLADTQKAASLIEVTTDLLDSVWRRRSAAILEYQMGFEDGTSHTLSDTRNTFMQRYDVKAAYIYQLFQKGIGIIRHPSRSNNLRPFLTPKPTQEEL